MKRKIIIFLLVIIVFLSTTTCLSCIRNAESSSLVLNADVVHQDGGFIISNNDGFDWINVKLYLNYEGDNITSGYQYYNYEKINRKEIHAHSVTSIVDFEFRNAKGDQFHSTLPLEELDKLLMQAETPDGKKGSYLKTWVK